MTTNEKTLATPATGAACPQKLMTLPEVMKLAGLKRERIRQLEHMGEFPQRVRITARRIGWVQSEVAAWLQNRIDQRRAA